MTKMHKAAWATPLLPLDPGGTNSTFFTSCCRVAICDNQGNCPSCGGLVVGWGASSDGERRKIRWEHAYCPPRRPNT